MSPEEKEWLRAEIDRARRRKLAESEILKVEYRIEHRVGDVAALEVRLDELLVEVEGLAPSPPADGQCCAVVDLGPVWTWALGRGSRCSRSATGALGRFCRTHARKRVGEYNRPPQAELRIAA